MRYRELLGRGAAQLQSAGVEEYEADAWLLLAHCLHRDRTWYYLHMEEEAGEQEQECYRKLLAKRCTRMPVQYITGVQEFMGLSFAVNPSVLIPRQDTEILVEECLKRVNPSEHVLDMCTGSGCILISLLHYGENLSGTGADVQEDALATARENAERNQVKAEFVQSDLFAQITGSYDMIVSNPPYISEAELRTLMPEVREYEPRIALDGKEDGLFFYRRIVREGTMHLRKNGWLCLEIGCGQGQQVEQLLRDGGYEQVQVIRDLAGLDRVVVGRRL